MSNFNISKLKHMTADMRVLTYLKNRKDGLDAVTCFDKIGVHRLSASIQRLRDAGHKIRNEEVVYEDRFGTEHTVDTYKLVG